MKYTVTINDKEYEVEVERGAANVLKTTTVAPVAVAAPAAAPAPVAAAPAPAAAPVVTGGGEPVNAPMPGLIVDVKVQQGTAVKEGDVVCIIEAMKMENEISAPKSGVISQVLVTKGASVESGAPLVTIQ